MAEEIINPSQTAGGGDADIGPADMPWMTPGIKATFMGNNFSPHRLEHDTPFYRYFDEGHMVGPGVWYLSEDLYSSSTEAAAKLALSSTVTKNTASMVVTVVVPAGTVVARGRAAPQDPKNKYPGGGSQVIIGNPRDQSIRYGAPIRLP